MIAFGLSVYHSNRKQASTDDTACAKECVYLRQKRKKERKDCQLLMNSSGSLRSVNIKEKVNLKSFQMIVPRKLMSSRLSLYKYVHI